MTTLALFVLLQLPANLTTPNGEWNGRFWLLLPDNERVLFLHGYISGFKAASLAEPNAELKAVETADKDDLSELRKLLAAAVERGVKLRQQNIPSGTIREIQKGVDRFYAAPENVNIPIWIALRVVALQFRARPESEIQAELESARWWVRRDLERCEKENVDCEHLR